MMLSPLAVAFALLAQAAPNQAEIEQIGAPDAPGAAAGGIAGLQLGETKRGVEAAPPSPPPYPLDQLNTEAPRAAAVDDQPLSAPFERPNQLNSQAATAEAPEGPPSPWPRRATVDPVTGEDACDPARPGAAEDEACADRIETRAAEFAPPPSAEDRLLSESEPSGADARASARRLADGDVRNSEAAEAYVFTSGLQPPVAPSSASPSPDAQKALDAAAQLIGVLPPGAIVTTR
jgi:hypothetical protein